LHRKSTPFLLTQPVSYEPVVELSKAVGELDLTLCVDCGSYNLWWLHIVFQQQQQAHLNHLVYAMITKNDGRPKRHILTYRISTEIKIENQGGNWKNIKSLHVNLKRQ